MALEVSDTSEVLRLRLAETFTAWSAGFTAVIWEAQSAAEVDPELDAEEAACALLQAWQGAMLRMRNDRDPARLERFQRLIFQRVLNVQGSETANE